MTKVKLHIVILIVALITNHVYAANNFSTEQQNSINLPLLLEPSDKSAINSLTPIFRWHKVEGNDVEYRLLVAEKNGKIIVDNWINNDTIFVVTDSSLFKDLEVYRWNIIAMQGDASIQSETNAFWIDLNIRSDLELRSIKPLSKTMNRRIGDDTRFEIEVLNCGPSPTFKSKVKLLSGNNNRNYYGLAAIEKVKVLDSTIIDYLKPNESRKVKLRGEISDGFNHFYAEIETEKKDYDKLLDNNFKSGPLIQTINDKWQLNGLFVIYTQYQDFPETIQKISDVELSEIDIKIKNTQQFFWDHTQIVKIEADTLHINRLLTDEDFSYINDNWGYVLGPKDVEKDLRRRRIGNDAYDFIFVYYPWRNSLYSWSGFRGYTYGTVKTILGRTAFAAQPIIIQQDEQSALITIHEILHIIDHFFESSGIKSFYSPDEKELRTSFSEELDYYQWILETWPSSQWFKLNWGNKIAAKRSYVYENDNLPRHLVLYQNYPNPFNATTTISYRLANNSSSTENRHITLAIYNLLGKRVRTLVNDYKKPGFYSVNWDGNNELGEPVSSGIYIYRITTQNSSQIKKLLFLK